jgi:polysaccharide biosynthesis protein PslH
MLGNAQSGNPASKMVKPDGVKPTLLYISPVVPLLTGNGLAMRAGTVLELLAEWYSVSLLVVKLYPPFDAAIPEVFRNISERTAIINPPERSRWSTLPCVNALSPASRYRRIRFDVVHVFRLASVPHARKFLGAANSPAAHLDLDDIESITHTHIAQLCRKNGDDLLGRYEEWQSQKCRAAEEEAFRTFDRVYICSENDREKLKNRAGALLRILPNIVRLPDPPAAESGRNLLFLGTLGYYPNDDAACYLCREIIPRLNSQSSTEFHVNIVGPGASERLMKAANADGVGSVVSLRGSVADVEPWYRDALIVVVPVRVGGGTRIKILEAFSHLTPVVTTNAGIEGIDARHGEHVLIGDTPDEFAHHSSRLMEDSALRRRLAANAWKLLIERYSMEALKRTSDAFLPPEPRKESRSSVGSQLPR